MKKIRLNNKTEIPEIGLGTWKLKGYECIGAVRKALEIGYRHIDTAEIYTNEEEIGEAIKGFLRDKLFITSKVWPNQLNHDRVLKSCEMSLKKLRTDYIDLYLIHWPDKYLDIKDILKAFKFLYDQGKIKAFGVSNFTINHIKDTLKIADRLNLPITVNQVEFHPLLYQRELLDFCKKNNIVITAYSPIAKGRVIENGVIKEIARNYNKTTAQVSLRWLLDKGTVVIPKAKSEKHLAENLDVDFKLSEEDNKKIDNININQRLTNPGFAEFDY